MSFKHLTNTHHRRVLTRGVQYFDVMERHHTAKELLAQAAQFTHTSERMDLLVRDLTQALAGGLRVVDLKEYRATKVNLLSTRLRAEVQVMVVAQYIEEIVKTMHDNQTYEALLPSGKASIRIHYRRNGALVAFIPDVDSIPTYTDYVRDNYYRAEVGGIAPGLLQRYYSKPFLDVVRLCMSHGIISELDFYSA